uniref:carbonic anhydrase n=1 Tax=Hanusia phi TaxID=3032 RepID=A0A7S0HSV0_9CRYP|mmetsp:Transcript_34442/g.77660  ORF Transcript_34442/g.77660 Transcript_34442/m.77660 type:complete len:334 (+) Transcript_34442:81-1082(+)
MNQQMNNPVYDSHSKSQMGYDNENAIFRQRQSSYAMPTLFALVALSYAVNIPSLVVGVMAYIESHKTPTAQQPLTTVMPNSSTWSYTGATGPAYWMNLSPAYTTCGTGKKQSPINIDSSKTLLAAATDPDLRLSYFQDVGKLVQNDFSNKVTLSNDGYGIKITTLGLFMSYGTLWYQLDNLRFHTPSEHTINGIALPGEIQFHFQSTAQRTLILSVLVEEGGLASPTYLADVLAKIPTSSVGQVLLVSLDMTQMLTGVLFPNGGNTTYSVPYYTYSGSLTTPPCSEDVTWLVLQQTIKIAASDLFKLQSAEGQNARPVQAINDRVVRSKSGTV